MVVGFPESVSSRGSESLHQEDWASCRARRRWTFHLQGVEKKKGEVEVGGGRLKIRGAEGSKIEGSESRVREGWRLGVVNFELRWGDEKKRLKTILRMGPE